MAESRSDINTSRRYCQIDVSQLKNISKTPPASRRLNDKNTYAAAYIKEVSENSGEYGGIPEEENLMSTTMGPRSRVHYAGDLLKLMLLRGRMQSAAFETFVSLCSRQLCDILSVVDFVDWDYTNRDDAVLDWIQRRLGYFPAFSSDGYDKAKDTLDIDDGAQDYQYFMPQRWLAVMIARSFTNLSAVFDHMRSIHHLGDLDEETLQDFKVICTPPADAKFSVGNPQTAVVRRDADGIGSDTFAMWLPEGRVEIDQMTAWSERMSGVSQLFDSELLRLYEQYMRYYDIPLDEFQRVMNGIVAGRDWEAVRDSYM